MNEPDSSPESANALAPYLAMLAVGIVIGVAVLVYAALHRAEIIAIERTFPELALARKRRAVRRSLAEATDRTRRMSAAARKAISARMKRYWAERRKARAKVR